MFGAPPRQSRLAFAVCFGLSVPLALLTACSGGEAVDPTPEQYTVGGSVTGLTGSGLTLRLDNGAEAVIPGGATSFTFPGTMNAGAPFNVVLKAQPAAPTQVCTVSGGSGTVRGNVTSIAVSCTTTNFVVGGTIAGLTGSGLTLLLNGGSAVSPAAGSGGFSFPPIASGTSYTVTVGTQPTPTGAQSVPQTCSVANGTGVVGAANVANIVVTCVAVSYTVGGTIAGLLGSGLVLQNNLTNDVSPSVGATTFSFTSPVTAGAPYSVSVKTQPSNPAQTCTVANGSGIATGNTLVAVSCALNSLTVGGTVSGLSSAGLALLLNGSSPLSLNAGATSFAFPTTVAAGSTYTVAIAAHPTSPGQTCTLANATGTVGQSGITNVNVSCTTNPANTWTVGGAITGLANPGLVLANGGASIGVAAGSTTFALSAVPNGSSYSVTIVSQPANQTCTVNNANGTVSGGNVVGVSVACQAATYTIGGTITGYAGTGLRLLLNGATPRLIAAGGTTFVFPAAPSGTSYEVTVGQQPSSPLQSCTVTNGTGVIGNANVVNVAVTCVNVFAITGTIANQNSNGLVLLLNGGSPLSRNVDAGTFSFAGLPTGSPYSVTVGTQPNAPPQTCTVANGNGTVASANVTNIVVTCINNGPIVGGTIQGYTGGGLTLRINGGAPMAPQANTRFTFPNLYPPGTDFSASIATQPTGQTCTLIRGAGRITPSGGNNNVQNILVQCIANATSPLSGTYAVLIGGKQNYLTFWTDGTYSYASRLDDAACGGGNGNGVEYGVYNWNATTGAVSFLTGAVDSNGSCGMYNSVTQVGRAGTLTKAAGTLTMVTTGGTQTLTAVTNTLSAFVGSFQAEAEQNGSFVVFQPDNTYVVVTTQANSVAPSGNTLGYERGCFTSTSSTVTFSLSASCRPDGVAAIDLNGTAGLSDGGLGVPLSYSITGPNTLNLDGTVLTRLLGN